MTTCPFTEAAEEIVDAAGLIRQPILYSVSRWNLRLALVGAAIIGENDGREAMPESRRRDAITGSLRFIAADAASILIGLDVEDPAAAFVAEYERAAAKHPGMTLDADGHTDESRFYALAEEVGEVAASLTYDNAQGTGHNADLVAEVTQVGALALAWLVRYQDGEER